MTADRWSREYSYRISFSMSPDLTVAHDKSFRNKKSHSASWLVEKSYSHAESIRNKARSNEYTQRKESRRNDKGIDPREL